MSFNGKGNKYAVGNKYWIGKKHREDSKLKMKLANLGKRYSMSTEFRGGMMPWNLGIPSPWLSEKNRTNNPTKRGSESHLWKGGITSINTAIRNSIAYEEWRKAVFERDSYTCQICFEVGGKLNADHIKRFSDYPELRLELSNGRTLCEECHRQTETYGRSSIYRKNLNSQRTRGLT